MIYSLIGFLSYWYFKRYKISRRYCYQSTLYFRSQILFSL